MATIAGEEYLVNYGCVLKNKVFCVKVDLDARCPTLHNFAVVHGLHQTSLDDLHMLHNFDSSATL